MRSSLAHSAGCQLQLLSLSLVWLPAALDASDPRAFIRWVNPRSPNEHGVVDVPSADSLSCEVFAWIDDALLTSGSSWSVCIQVAGSDKGLPSLSFCEEFHKPGLVSFHLPLYRFDGETIDLLAEIRRSADPEVRADAAFASDDLQIKKWLRKTRVSPAWSDDTNPLVEWWDSYRSGLLAGKGAHYFDVYHRHLSHLRGHPVHLLEIGVANGGSLEMWKAYFGPAAQYTGVDCCPWPGMRARLEDNRTSIWIGDQVDVSFWKALVSSQPPLDIVVDDGGHKGQQQVASFRALWPHVAPGGIYIVEDLQFNYVEGEFEGGLRREGTWIERLKDLVDEMQTGRTEDLELEGSVASIAAISIYPNMCVIEKSIPGAHTAGSSVQVSAGNLGPALDSIEVPTMRHPL
ncbi:unnamed protein product [Polarella glacialis]|uniref:Uncharacterized protein n=1 Tax=Polarella glacialis TaxID=89957 RepID=A0A813J0B6_POLGL|nr:unnamed protein product [Polarella glacialis]